MNMRNVKLFCLAIVLLLVGEFALVANATPIEFETTTYSDSQIQKILENINLQAVYEDSGRSAIQCFDVHANGKYALAFGKGGKCRIYVYDPNGVFLYGFRFDSTGAYSIQFRGDLLEIYLVRGDTIVTVDNRAECVEIRKVLATEQNTMNVRSLFDCSTKEMGGKIYELERDIAIGDSYSRFVVIQEDGEKTVLLDLSAENTAKQLLLVASLLLFFVIAVAGIRKKNRYEHRTD